MTLEALLARWRSDADVLRRRGSVGAADLLAGCARELEDAMRMTADQDLSLREAAGECGYSVAHLRRLIRCGQLSNVGSGGRVHVRRSELPRKPGTRPSAGEAATSVLRLQRSSA